MMNWTKEEHITIENVDHEVIILGVRPTLLPMLAIVASASLIINPLLVLVGPSVIIYLARKFYKYEEKGSPLDYEIWFRDLTKYGPIKAFFPSVPYLKHRERGYR